MGLSAFCQSPLVSSVEEISSAPVRSRISLCSLDPLGIVAVHGEQNSSFFHSAFVALGFILWNPHAHQGSGNAAHYATGTGSSECTLDRTSGD
jgi:hypothetical protein